MLAFFLESTFLGLWIFGWDRLPRVIHTACIWLAALGTNLSAIFILAANSFMQNPQGAVYNPVTDRAEMADFGAVLTNPHDPADLVRSLNQALAMTPSERIALVERLTRNAWAFKGERIDGARLRRDVVRTRRGGG